MKRLIYFLIVFLLMLICIETAVGLDWKSINAELVDQTTNESQTILTIKDKQNRLFKVIYQDEEMMTKLAGNILKVKNEFYAWRNIEFKDISFMVYDNLFDVVIMPQKFIHRNLNLASVFPAGITMTCNPERNNIHYDFRIMKDEQLIRISNDYSKEEELISRVRNAYDNPNLYLQPPRADILQPAEEGMNEKALQALIYMYNEDWNGRKKVVKLEVIHQVVELKRNNPEMNKMQLWQEIKKAKIKVTKREFELILIFYFNEFD